MLNKKPDGLRNRSIFALIYKENVNLIVGLPCGKNCLGEQAGLSSIRKIAVG